MGINCLLSHHWVKREANHAWFWKIVLCKDIAKATVPLMDRLLIKRTCNIDCILVT